MLYCRHDTGLMVALTLSSPDKLFSRCPKQSERGFIRENNFTLVLSSPIPVPFAEYQSVPDGFPGEKCPDPAAESTLGDGPGARWIFLGALKPSSQQLNRSP